MVQVTKEEAMEIRKKFPNVHITITSKQTSHKRYWAEETGAVKRFLSKKRGVSDYG